jgi:hypothetical protein
MAREYVAPEGFESMRAVLEITGAEEYIGTSKDGARFEKVNFEYKVIDYEEAEDDEGAWIGEAFTDGAYYKNGGVPPTGKLPNIIVACKGDGYFADLKLGRIRFEHADFIGDRLRAQVELNDAGYSTLFWKSIGPVSKRRRGGPKDSPKSQKQLPEDDAEAAKDEHNPLMNKGDEKVA